MANSKKDIINCDHLKLYKNVSLGPFVRSGDKEFFVQFQKY